MNCNHWRALAMASLMTCATQSIAQQQAQLQWHFGAGGSITTGTTGKYLSDGWIISGGLTWQPDPSIPIAIMGELHYSYYDATNEAVALGARLTNSARVNSGNGDIFGIDANGVYRFPVGNARGYITAGIGEYHRYVALNQTVLFAGSYCDPWWGFCYSGVTPGQAVVASESTTRFAWNAGIGIEFPVTPDGGYVYVDARYHQMQTSATTEFIPIQIGFRF